MPWNGAGVFNRLYSWASDKAAGIDITASRMDGDANDIVSSGFGNTLTRDGQGQPTSNLPMAGFRHTGAAAGVGTGDYVTVGQATNGTLAANLASLTVAGTSTLTGAATVAGALTVSGKAAAAMGTIPVGSGMDFWGSTAPAGYLLAAGQLVSRTTYDALFAVIGTTFNSGDGSTTFGIPDLRGRIPLVADNLGGTAANRVTSAVSGVASTTLGGSGGDQNAQAHSHTTSSSASSAVTDPTHSHTEIGVATNNQIGGSYIAATGNDQGVQTTVQQTAASSTGITVATTVSTTVNTAESGAAQNMPPVLVCNYIIYAGV